jgi:hypothetical protein
MSELQEETFRAFWIQAFCHDIALVQIPGWLIELCRTACLDIIGA